MFGFGGGGGNKRKGPPENTSGTGYGGQQGDTKKLLAGRKKAEKLSNKDDKNHTKFLKQIQKQLKVQLNVTSKSRRSKSVGLDRQDTEKVSSTLAHIFRNQVPADWDDRKELYTIALDVSRSLCDDQHGEIFGEKDDPEGILYWLLSFKQQAEQFTKNNLGSSKDNGSQEEVIAGWTKEDQNDVLLATHVSEVADLALKISKKCVSAKPEAELSVISLSERYQSQLGPLRFESVDSMENVSV